MNKIKNFIFNNYFNLFLMLLWLIIAAFSLYFHEIWRDEAQVWCLARDLSFFDILKASRIEGHPILWYLLVMPFAKSGIPVVSMQIISLFLVFLSICFVLFKSPFNKFEKVIIIFNAGMIYYLPIVSRDYCLIPVFLFSAAYLYHQRHDKAFLYILSIILLSYTHLYMLGFCLILSFMFFIEIVLEYVKTKNLKIFVPVIILIFNFLTIFLTFFKIDNYALQPDIRMGLSFTEVLVLISKIFIFNLFTYLDFAKSHFDIISIILFYPFLIVILLSMIIMSKKIGIICLSSILYIFFIFSKIFFNGILYQKAYLIFLILIFCFWTIKKINPIAHSDDSNVISPVISNLVPHSAAGSSMPSKCSPFKAAAFKFSLTSLVYRENLSGYYKLGVWAFYSLFIISCLVSPFVIFEDFKYNFSGSRQIAQYIRKNLNKETTFIAVGNPFLYSSVSAYLPDKKLYNVIVQDYVSYYSYYNDKKNSNVPFPEDAKYSIVQENIDFSLNPYLTLVFKNDKKNLSSKTEREVFSIYKQK